MSRQNRDAETQGDVLDTGVASDITLGCVWGWMSTASCRQFSKHGEIVS